MMQKFSHLNVGNMEDSVKVEISISNEQKVQILLHALEERYKSIHVIRDRVQNISLWVLGLFVTAGGWLLQSNNSFSLQEKLLFGGFILVSVIVLRVFYLNDLEKGFKAQQRIQNRIEKALGLCKSGIFIQESIYPEEWVFAGTKKGKGNFFFHNYLLIYLGTVILLLCICFH